MRISDWSSDVCSSDLGRLNHVKAHGALYNMAVKNPELARALAQAVYDVDPGLVFFGLASNIMVEVARDIGLTVAEEVFADRTYQNDGSLTPRSRPEAMIVDSRVWIQQVLSMVCRQKEIGQQTGRERGCQYGLIR